MPTDGPLRIHTSALNARLSSPQVASTITRLVAGQAAVCAADICRITGLARTTVAASISGLVQRDVMRYDGVRETIGRGRPAERLVVNRHFGVTAVIEIEPGEARVTAHDLAQLEFGSRTVPFNPADAPSDVLDRCASALFDVLGSVAGAENLCVVVSIGASVDSGRGAIGLTHGLPLWTSVPVVDILEAALGCTVVIESEANLAALGESRVGRLNELPLVLISVSHGIGCGIIEMSGSIFRGASGAAGDIAHLKHREAGDSLCYCGRSGCLDSVSSGATLAQSYAVAAQGDEHRPPLTLLTEALQRLDPRAIGIVQEAGARIGDAVIDMVQFLNPAKVVIAGQIGAASDHLGSAVRERVFQHASGLAVRNLAISPPLLGPRAARAGAVIRGVESLLSPESLHDALRPRMLPLGPRSAMNASA